MFTARKSIRFGMRSAKLGLALAAATLALPAWADDNPPDPPVKPSQEITVLRHQTFASDVTDDPAEHAKNGHRQGTMTWSEWWYSYSHGDSKMLVGIAVLTITPINPEGANTYNLSEFSVRLAHNVPGCTHQDSDPKPNSAGIQLSGGITGTLGKDGAGIELGGSISGTVRADGVTINQRPADNTSVEWQASISGPGTLRSGVSNLVFQAVWTCPGTADFRDRVSLLGYGTILMDGPGRDDPVRFSGGGSFSPWEKLDYKPLKGSRRSRWFRDENGNWVHAQEPQPASSSKGASATPGKDKPQSGFPKRNDISLPTVPDFGAVRTNEAIGSGTNVAIPFYQDHDLTNRTRATAFSAMREAERTQGWAVGGGLEAPLATAPQDDASEPLQPYVDTPVKQPLSSPPAVEAVPGQPTTEQSGVVGTWRLADPSSGASQVTIRQSGSSYVLSGLGQDVLLEQSGNTWFGEGAVLFGQGGHQLRLTSQGDRMLLQASNGSGGSFWTTMVR
jgi:hypothetical protein